MLKFIESVTEKVNSVFEETSLRIAQRRILDEVVEDLNLRSGNIPDSERIELLRQKLFTDLMANKTDTKDLREAIRVLSDSEKEPDHLKIFFLDVTSVFLKLCLLTLILNGTVLLTGTCTNQSTTPFCKQITAPSKALDKYFFGE